jgi:hypothetical protein
MVKRFAAFAALLAVLGMALVFAKPASAHGLAPRMFATSSACYYYPGDGNCDGLYPSQVSPSCPDIVQQPADNGYIHVDLHFAGFIHCETNWATAYTKCCNYVVVRVEIQRADGKSYTDGTNGSPSQMVFSPYQKARACGWYAPYGINKIYGPVCTNYQ